MLDPQGAMGHEVLLTVAGGVALLLWATRMVRTGILRAFGSQVRTWLGRSTRSRPQAFMVGLGVTGLLQSSTATALLLMSFASRGMIATASGLATMLGADLGSTLVVQVLSLDISALSPALILIGVVAFLAGGPRKVRQVARIIIGLGLMLLSLQLIVGASEPLRASETLATVMEALTGEPVLALLIAAGIAWLSHSSVATVLLAMSLTASSVIPLQLGFVLVLGANAGSGLIPVFLSLNSDPVARRIPLGNLAFRVLGALLALPLVAVVMPYIEVLSGDAARQIANFHTLFNIGLAIVFLPLTGVAAAIAIRLLPTSERDEDDEGRPRYLDDSAIETPPVAMACATREAMRMADIVEEMLRDTLEVLRNDDSALVREIERRDDVIDELDEAIKLYLTEVSRNALDEEDSARTVELISFTTNLEHIGDIVEKNLMELAQKKIRNRQQFSPEGWRELAEIHERIMQNMQLAMSVFVSRDIDAARKLIAEKEALREMEREASERHLQRLREGQVESLETTSLHLDLIRDLKRINSHMTAVAYPIVEASGELRTSRLKKKKVRDRAPD